MAMRPESPGLYEGRRREMNVRVLPDGDDVARSGAELFVVAANESVARHGRFTVALSGGHTPKALYERLASEVSVAEVPWARCFFFFGDDRHVAPDHPDSNYRMAREALLSRLPIDPAQVVRIKGELDSAELAAFEYEKALRAFFHLPSDQFPQFDLLMLGLGPDGHIASLFPGTSALHERSHLVVANWVQRLDTYRITLTVPVLNKAARVMLLVQGAQKALALKAVLQGPYEPLQFPAQLIQPRDTVTWLVDRAAAALLDPPPSHKCS